MDPVSENDTSTGVAGARRKRMREAARGLRIAPSKADGYRTPEWLDRSFVLPLTTPEVSQLPSQSVPHHDDDEAAPAQPGDARPAAGFVRPETPGIDFSKVIRRADLSRSATHTAMVATGVTGLVLIGYLLTSSAVVLGMAIAFGLVAVVAAAVRLRLATAGIPHLDP